MALSLGHLNLLPCVFSVEIPFCTRNGIHILHKGFAWRPCGLGCPGHRLMPTYRWPVCPAVQGHGGLCPLQDKTDNLISTQSNKKVAWSSATYAMHQINSPLIKVSFFEPSKLIQSHNTHVHPNALLWYILCSTSNIFTRFLKILYFNLCCFYFIIRWLGGISR